MPARPRVCARRWLPALGAFAVVVLAAGPGGGGGGGGSGGRDSPRERGGDGFSPAGLAVAAGMVGVLAAGAAVYARLKPPLRLTELAVVLPGDVIPRLDALMGAADFSTPAARAWALAALVAAARAHDVRDGRVRHRGESKLAAPLLAAAAGLYRERMATAGLGDRDAAAVLADRAADAPSPACLLGVITTTRGREPAEEGGREAAEVLLGALVERAGPAPALLYVYYAPEPRRQLGEAEAADLLRALAPPA